MLTKRLQRLLVMATMAALVAAMVAFPSLAHAEVVLDVYDENYTPKNPVQDNITRLYVNKLDKSDRRHVEGATLAIIEESTGKVVDTWVSDGKPHEIARNVQGIGEEGALDIDTWYILKELVVPDGYSTDFMDLQNDPDHPSLVRFRLHSTDFNTTGELEIDDAISEFVDDDEMHGSGPEQAYVINLYNESVEYVEEQQEQKRTAEREKGNETSKKDEKSNKGGKDNSSTTEETKETESSRGGGSLTTTGDYTSNVPIVVLVVAALGVIGLAIWRRK